MSTYNRVVAADETASLAPTVRARLATEMADPTSDVGASLSGTFDALTDAASRAASNAEDAVLVSPIASQFRSPFTGVFVSSATSSVSGELDYSLMQGLGGGRFATWLLRCSTGLGGYDLNQLADCSVGLAMLSVDQEDASVVRAGTWSGDLAGALAYDGTYRHSTTAASTLTWTTPVASESVGLRGASATNAGGLAKVTIDGDATIANLLPTAQDVVDSDAFANTILVANGGDLNPTDRVFTQYGTTLNYDVFTPFASKLADTTHAVVITVTGYQRIGSAGARVYVSGVMYGGNTTVPTTSTAEMVSAYQVHDAEFSSAAWEYADQVKPLTSGTLTYVGNIHGYDEQTSLAVTIGDDVAATAFSNGTITESAESMFTIVRDSTLHHPDSATPVATVVTTYRLDRNGLAVTSEITYLQDVQVGLSYAMLPANGVNSTGDAFDRVAFIGGKAFTLDGSGDTRFGFSRSAAAWVWPSVGNVAALMWLPDAWGFTDNWARNGGTWTSVQDRAGDLTKLYFTWLGSRGPFDIASGTTKRRDARYLVTVFDGGAEVALG